MSNIYYKIFHNYNNIIADFIATKVSIYLLLRSHSTRIQY